MITRRNWLLKCSILVNIAVLLYICSHVMVGNNTNNFGVSGSGSASYLIQQLSPTSHQQSTQQQKSSISSAQALQDEQELAAILRNKEMELQRQMKTQETAQVGWKHCCRHLIPWEIVTSLSIMWADKILALVFPPRTNGFLIKSHHDNQCGFLLASKAIKLI